MADSHDNARLPDSHPEQCEHHAAPERDAVVLQAWDWWLAARRARCAIPDGLSNAEADELAGAYCDVWDAADVIACATPAHAPEAVAAKLRMAFGHMVQSADGEEAFLSSGGANLEPDKELQWPAQMLASAIRDLERMAQEARA